MPPPVATIAQVPELASLVGAWRVTVDGAPYGPHLLSFYAGGIVATTNPSGVQELADGKGTHDSLGMGSWETVAGDGNAFEVTFVQLNASQVTASDPTPKATDELVVTCRIRVTQDAFTGHCQAGLTPSGKPVDLNSIREATLKGSRIVVNRTMLAKVDGRP